MQPPAAPYVCRPTRIGTLCPPKLFSASSRNPSCVMDVSSVVECGCGIAAAAGGQWDLAETHFINALHVTRTAPHVPAEPDVLHWHAWMLLQRRASGDVERAVGMLRECVALCERVGLPRRARLAAEMLRNSAEGGGTA